MEKITTAGIDLAKRVFALHGVDGAGRVGLRKTVRREQLMQTVAALPPCLIGMEACSGAHEWARRVQDAGGQGASRVAWALGPLSEGGEKRAARRGGSWPATRRPADRHRPSAAC